jgi:hypothetical protein
MNRGTASLSLPPIVGRAAARTAGRALATAMRRPATWSVGGSSRLSPNTAMRAVGVPRRPAGQRRLAALLAAGAATPTA